MTDARLRWESTGTGPPLLLIQGLGYPSAMWFRVLPLLARRFEVITFDNRGIGGNAGLPIDGLTIECMAEDAASVAAASAEEPMTIVGVSLGGIVAQQLALAHPHLVDRLVLASTHTCDAHGVAADDDVLEMYATRSQLPPDEALRASVPYAYAPDTPSGLIEEDLACRTRHPVDAEVTAAQLAAARRFEGTWMRLPDLAAPTLVLHGDGDRIVPPANADVLAERIPSAELRWIRGGGHNLFSERAADFAQAVGAFALSR